MTEGQADDVTEPPFVDDEQRVHDLVVGVDMIESADVAELVPGDRSTRSAGLCPNIG